MFIRISSMTEDQVFSLLQDADLNSSYHVGSHTDSYNGIVVNGTILEPFGYHYQWVSMQSSDYEDRKIDPTNRLPEVSEILTAAIVDTHHRYGGNSRDRARIQIFARPTIYHEYTIEILKARESGSIEDEKRIVHNRKSAQPFIVFDIGEVEGWKPVSKGQKTDVSIMWAIWSAVKNVRVEVDTKIDPITFSNLKKRSVEGADPCHYHNHRALTEDLKPENAQKWFESEISSSVKLRNILFSSAPTINNYCWNKENRNEEALGMGVREDLFKAFQVLWTALPLGDLLSNLGLK